MEEETRDEIIKWLRAAKEEYELEGTHPIEWTVRTILNMDLRIQRIEKAVELILRALLESKGL
ncbi:MAG: hypothetical protein DRN15_09415 [Thermoprotei archaeon]|nr:MAG: hypothetical protein DRN15_09415 [Thermoprotei archaeon]